MSFFSTGGRFVNFSLIDFKISGSHPDSEISLFLGSVLFKGV